MPAKPTTKSQIQPPKSAVMVFRRAVMKGLRDVEKGKTLSVAKARARLGLSESLREARKKFKEKRSNEDTIAEAVKWARKRSKS